MKSSIVMIGMQLTIILSGCSSAATLVQEAATEEIYSTPTPLSSEAKFHPLDTETGNSDIDIVLSAVASGDPQELVKLFSYTTTACKTVNALGGPPPCLEGEREGTIVEVLPFLGSEGSFLRKDDANHFPGLNTIWLYAVYEVSDAAYFEANYPAGDYGLLFGAKENSPAIILQVKNGMIVRIDYVFDNSSFDVILKRDAKSMVLEPLK